MKVIPRDRYLHKLVEREFDGLVKIITGIRRCGKSYLLFKLYRNHLIESGVDQGNIIAIDLEDPSYDDLRDYMALYNHIKSSIDGKPGPFYVLIDEVQRVDNFVDLVNGIRHLPDTDVFITGSNSKFLSSDIVTEFRGRSEEIRVRPLSFSEFVSVYDGPKDLAWADYMRYGGMPESVLYPPERKEEYLCNLVRAVYLLDVREKNRIMESEYLEPLMSALCSSVGSLTNISRIVNTMSTAYRTKVDNKTVSRYLEMLLDAFLFERSQRYDVKGRKYFNSICKYYIADVGLRNAWLGYRQQEPTHIMENIIYNELRLRGYSVDVGMVHSRADNGDGPEYIQMEIDFIASKGNERLYIQSAYSIPDEKKHDHEIRPFLKVNDSFRKILIVNGNERPWTDEYGITTIGIMNFLLDENLF